MAFPKITRKARILFPHMLAYIMLWLPPLEPQVIAVGGHHNADRSFKSYANKNVSVYSHGLSVVTKITIIIN